jgi:hypothetical protein
LEYQDEERSEISREMERKIECHDKDIIAIFSAIRQIMKEEEKPPKKFGFV